MKRKRIPYFEALVSLLSYYLATVCMFNNNIFSQFPRVYGSLENLGSETTFAMIFMVAATIKVIGLLINCHALRKIGLGLSSLIYLVITVSYAMSDVPFSWGLGIFALLSAFSALTIFDVKNTKLME